jgi:hypothetical protein
MAAGGISDAMPKADQSAERTAARGLWFKHCAAHSPVTFERLLSAASLACLAAYLSLMASPLFRGRIPTHGDLGLLNLPIRQFYARCLETGDAFDWTPDIFGGYFVTGEGQHGPYHPFRWLSYRFLPLDSAFALEVFAPVLMMAVGLLVFLRRFVPFPAACLGALFGTFSLMFIGHVQHPQASANLAHLPWLLLTIDLVAGAPDWKARSRGCASVALLVGSQALFGHPQTLWFSLNAGALFALCVTAGKEQRWTIWSTLISGVFLGACLGAVQLLPTASHVAGSARSTWNKWDEGLPPNAFEAGALAGVVAPHEGGTFLANYLGAVPLVLGLWWISVLTLQRTSEHGLTTSSDSSTLLCRRRGDRRLQFWALVTTVLGALLSLGLPGKLYYAVIVLPLVGSFRCPSRYALISQFSASVLAAVAFGRLVASIRTGERYSFLSLAAPWLAAGLTVAAAAPKLIHRDALEQCLQALLLIALAAIGLTLAARGRRMGLALLVAVTAVDIGCHCMGHPFFGHLYWRNTRTLANYAQRYPAEGDESPIPPVSMTGGRILDERKAGLCHVVEGLLFHNRRVLNGYNGVPPTKVLDYGTLNALRVSTTEWVWPMPTREPNPALAPPSGGGWCRVPAPLPRVRLVSQVQFSANAREDLTRIPIDDVALVSVPLELPSSPPGRAELIEDRPGRISVMTDAPDRQLLVLAESRYEGWEVFVDSLPSSLVPANGDFMGCIVERGRHKVEFRFCSRILRLGMTISIVASGVAAALVVWPVLGSLRNRLISVGQYSSSAVLTQPARVAP